MADLVKLSFDKTALKLLMDLIGQEHTVCLIGYQLSYDAGVPHFYDLQNGCWSRAESLKTFNPFRNQNHYQRFISWYNWRANAIHKLTTQTEPYKSLKELHNSVGFAIYNQNVDGLAEKHELPDLSNFYGSISSGKCHSFNHSYDYKSSSILITDQICPHCESNIFPDVVMFGWNTPSLARNEYLEHIGTSKLLIRIGADQKLFGYDDWEYSLMNIPILDINDHGVFMNYRSIAYSLRVKDIQQNPITSEISRHIKAASNIELLMKIINELINRED